jgi:hypothetical protein
MFHKQLYNTIPNVTVWPVVFFTKAITSQPPRSMSTAKEFLGIEKASHTKGHFVLLYVTYMNIGIFNWFN